MDDDNRYMATLIHGMRYSILLPSSGEVTVFTKGNSVPISEEMKRALEAAATDTITINEGYGERSFRLRCKFSFEPITKPAA